jgi:ABC-type nitrate/sulfonate/bicarbonate transport system substrate-binding protein
VLDRRTFLRRAAVTGLAVMAGPAALTACAGQARDQQGPLGLVQFGVGFDPDNVLSSWFTIADRLGYFAEEGVDSEVKRVATPLALVRAGRLQCGQQTPAELLPFVAENPSSDLVIGWTPVPRPFLRTVVPATSDVREFSDLRGKRMATPGPGRLRWFIDAMCVGSGMSPSELKQVTVPAGPALLAAFGQNRVDAGMLTGTLIAQANEQLAGDPVGPLRVLPFPDALTRTGGNLVVFRGSTLDRNRDLYTGYLRGVAKGWTFLNANVAAGVSIHLDAYPRLRRAGETRQQTIDRLVRELTPTLEVSKPPDWATEKHPWGWTYEENLTDWEKIIPVLAGKKIDSPKLYTNDLVGPAYDFDAAAIVKAAQDHKTS